MAIRSLFRLDDDHPFTGRHMLLVTVAGFAVVIAVNGIMAAIATGTFPGLVVKNSYVASQGYNDLLAEARRQSARGWTLKLEVIDGRVVAAINASSGQMVSGLDVTAIAGRPSSVAEDRRAELAETPSGYRAQDTLPAGQWNVDIEARRDGNVVFRERKRIFVTPRGES
jgi:nitrogen fixation protein FixH